MMQRISEILSSLALWESSTLKTLGIIEIILSLFMMVPGLFAILLGEDPMPFLVPVPFILILGVFQALLFGRSENYTNVDGLIMVALAWLVMFIVGSLPYMQYGMDPLDSLFESVSGFTTTGNSGIGDVFAWPQSLMIWRSMSQWIGGIAVILIFMYILPLFGMGRSFFTNELEGSGSSKYSVKLKNAAKSFIIVYVALTGANLVLLLICNASLLDAFCLSMTTISTGGLLCTNNSLVDLNVGIQLVTMVFMFIGGVNFYLHYKAIYNRSLKVYRENKEFKLLTMWFLFMAVVLYLLYAMPKIFSMGFDLGANVTYFKDALFTVVSMGTTSGFATFDYSEYSQFALFLIFMVTFIGASAGSTSGGIKFGRIRVVLRFFRNALMNTIHPNAVYSVKVDGQDVDDSRVLSAVSVTLLYFITMFIAVVFLLTEGIDWHDSFGLAMSTITNTGSGFGSFGPLNSGVTELSGAAKVFLMVLMWVGRLEIMLALVFFTPSFWKDVRNNYRVKKRKNRISRNN